MIAIMAILAATSTSIYTGYIKKAKSAEYLANCRAVFVASEAYFIECKDSFTASDDDLEHMGEEISGLTQLDVVVLDYADLFMSSKANCGVIVDEVKSGKWKCVEVLCDIDGDIWSFDTESGEFEKEN